MVEDMEEGVKRLRGCHPLLNVIDYQHVDGLVELDEVIDGILPHRIGVLHLEQTCRDIQHTLLRVQFLTAYADGVNQVSLATP